MLRRTAWIGMICAALVIVVLPAASNSAPGKHHGRCTAGACKSKVKKACPKGQFRHHRTCVPRTTPEAPLAVAEAPVLPLDASFLGLTYPASAHPPRRAIEQFSLSTGAPLRTLLWMPEDSEQAGFAAGPEGSLWLTVSSGPKYECGRCEESSPVPDSCRGEVLRFDPTTGSLTTVRKFPSSLVIGGARPSPDGQWLLVQVAGCTNSYSNMHLLAINLVSGVEWTVGAQATACHELGGAAWNESGSELVFPFGASNLPAGTTEVPGAGGIGEHCVSPEPSALEIVNTGSSSEIPQSPLVEPTYGCSFRAAIFDSEGILAGEACSGVGPRGEAVSEPGPDYLVQLSESGEVLRRLPLEEGDCCHLSSDPQTGTIILSGGHSIWEYTNASLRLIHHHNLGERGAEEPTLTWGSSSNAEGAGP